MERGGGAMRLRDLQLGDILIINGEANHRVHRFCCESSSGDIYYHFPDQHPFVKFTGYETIEHFADNVYIYILKSTNQQKRK